MSVYAAQASFFIILAASPFIMLLLALIQLIPMVHEADLLSFAVHTVPGSLSGLVIEIIDSLYSGSPFALLSITAVTALWSASKGMLSIERGLNRVYGITTRRQYILRRLICSGYTVLFTVMCVFTLTLLVFGGMLQKQLLLLLPDLAHFNFLLAPARGIFSTGILMLFFLGIYTVLPHQKLHVRYQLPGALFASAGWIVFSVAFSIYFKYFKSYTITYGSLTAVILFMLWLYFGICILFMGAEINWFYHSWRRRG